MVKGWFYMTYALSFVEHDMFMCILSNKGAWSQFVFDVIDPIKHMDVWIMFPVKVLVIHEVSCWDL